MGGTKGWHLVNLFQSPIHRVSLSYGDLNPTGVIDDMLFQSPIHRVSLSYESLLNKGICPGHLFQSPIHRVSLSYGMDAHLSTFRKIAFQSPIHRVSLSYGELGKLEWTPILRFNPLFIGSHFPTDPRLQYLLARISVSIPYSSGLTFLPGGSSRALIPGRSRFNPLFIGSHFPTMNWSNI